MITVITKSLAPLTCPCEAQTGPNGVTEIYKYHLFINNLSIFLRHDPGITASRKDCGNGSDRSGRLHAICIVYRGCRWASLIGFSSCGMGGTGCAG